MNCPTCEGEGTNARHEMGSCGSCGGTGQYPIINFTPGYKSSVTCGACNGTGSWTAVYYDKCKQCGGTGSLPDPSPEQQLPPDNEPDRVPPGQRPGERVDAHTGVVQRKGGFFGTKWIDTDVRIDPESGEIEVKTFFSGWKRDGRRVNRKNGRLQRFITRGAWFWKTSEWEDV